MIRLVGIVIAAMISGAVHGFIVLPFCVFVVYSRLCVVSRAVIELLFVLFYEYWVAFAVDVGD